MSTRSSRIWKVTVTLFWVVQGIAAIVIGTISVSPPRNIGSGLLSVLGFYVVFLLFSGVLFFVMRFIKRVIEAHERL